ncbi:MAG: hypothetical protein GY778_17960, partial [bacterium]|nr:hypothetical protein [bacterium]
MRRTIVIVTAAVALAGAHAAWADDPFASQVIAYDPAPGQFVNVPEFDDPARALGPPQGGGTASPG